MPSRRSSVSVLESNVDRLLQVRAEIDEKLRRHKVPLTILFTDVVGSTTYFDLYGDTSGLAMLQRHASLASKTIAEHGGRVIKTIGDSVMAEFPQPEFGVRAAVDIQRRLVALNESLADPERLQLRIGINYGPTFRHGNDVYGDAVNVAARITKHSGPAQILISCSVQEAIAEEKKFVCGELGMVTIQGRTEKERLFEVVWTDPDAYDDLRQGLMAALCRGDLVSPGLKLEELVEPETGPISTVDSRRSETVAVSTPPAIGGNRYDMIGELGRGGMGVVYKARDNETGEVVALKVLKPEIASDEKIEERFKNELRIARRITHRNMCRIYEFHRTNGVAYISMEFVDGQSLRGLLKMVDTVPLRKGLNIASQICAGLAEAHRQGIIHRDLKPENIMIDSTGTVKVMDFGIAHSLDPTKTISQSAAVIGTPAYMSPEQAEGNPIDARTDVYAVGLILYEMFTGQRPFDADTPVSVAMKHIREAPRPPREIELSIPLPVETMILKCLEKDPAQRFRSVDELEKEIGSQSALLPAETAESQRRSWIERLTARSGLLGQRRQTILQEPWLLLLAGAVVILVVAIIANQPARLLGAKPLAPSSPAPTVITAVTAAPAPSTDAASSPLAPSEKKPPGKKPSGSESAKSKSTPPAQPQAVQSGEAIGHVLVKTEPEGAKIWVDGKETTYHSPVNFTLPPGRHTVKLEQSGFDIETHYVTVSKNQTTEITATLKSTKKHRRLLLFH